MRFFLIVLLLGTFLYPPAQAASSLQDQAKAIEKNLAAMQKKLIRLADSMQKNEKEANTLDRDIAHLENEQTGIQAQLQKDRGTLADLIAALERIRRLPPEALMVKPEAPLQTAQSAMLLQDALPGLYEKAESLKANLEKNEKLTQELREKRTDLRLLSDSLQKEHRTLSALAKKREALYRKTQKDLAAEEARTQKIALNAGTLKDLVKNLDEERKRRHARQLTQSAVSAAPPKRLPRTGQARLPVSGVIKTRFNEPDAFGAPNQGLDIAGRGGALVVAPMAGIIRFSGPFKNYGKMVIIEHQDGYHSLVAGLETLDTVVGQTVLAGEPLGLLHYASGQEKPVLYYELRYNGKAVNPARKFPDLG